MHFAAKDPCEQAGHTWIPGVAVADGTGLHEIRDLVNFGVPVLIVIAVSFGAYRVVSGIVLSAAHGGRTPREARARRRRLI